MVRDLDREQRRALDAVLNARPGEADPETGGRPPPGFSEEEMSKTAEAFAAAVGMRRGR